MATAKRARRYKKKMPQWYKKPTYTFTRRLWFAWRYAEKPGVWCICAAAPGNLADIGNNKIVWGGTEVLEKKPRRRWAHYQVGPFSAKCITVRAAQQCIALGL